MNIWVILGALLVFGVIILVHELGHFCSGKLLGFRIDEFAIGFGPALLKRNRDGTCISLRAFPIGGYVRFHGEDEDVASEGAFFSMAPWKRFIAIFAGAFMNIVFAFTLAVAILSCFGVQQAAIKQVNPDSPALRAGLQSGDIITSVNGKKLSFAYELYDSLAKADPSGVVIGVQRGGVEMSFAVKEIYSEAEKRNMIGVVIDPESPVKKYNFAESVMSSFKLMGYYVRDTYRFIINIFNTPNLSEQVVGPVGTISLMGQAITYGLASVLSMAMTISLSLAIFNLLPIPALDGMRLVFIAYEMIFKKPIPRDKEGMVHLVGLVLLFGLIIFVSYNDIMRLLGG